MSDELLNGGALVKFEMERRAKELQENKERERKDKLVAQSRVLRMLTTDDLIRSIRENANNLKAEALLKVLDPTKRQPGDTLETLATEARCHDMYVKMFDDMEITGKRAAETLLKESKAKE